MAKSTDPTLLQGALDLPILHSSWAWTSPGCAIAQTIHLLSDEVLKVEEGSLYPALTAWNWTAQSRPPRGCPTTTAKQNTTRSRSVAES